MHSTCEPVHESMQEKVAVNSHGFSSAGDGTALCTVHLINEGVLVYGYNISVQFVGSSSVRFYLCRMDAGSWFTCERYSLVVTDYYLVKFN